MNQRVTSNRDGSVIGTLKAIDLINSYDWNTLIAGHGTITDKKLQILQQNISHF